MDNQEILNQAPNGYVTVNSGTECLAHKVNVNEVGNFESYLNAFGRPSLTVIIYRLNGKTDTGIQNFRKAYSGNWTSNLTSEDHSDLGDTQETPDLTPAHTTSNSNNMSSDVLQLRVEILTKDNQKLEKQNDKLSNDSEALYKKYRELKEELAIIKREHELTIRELKQEHRFELEKLERDNSNSLGSVASNLLSPDNIKSLLPVVATMFGRTVPAELPESTHDSNLSPRHNELIKKVVESFREIDEVQMALIYDVVSEVYKSEFQLAHQILQR